MENVTLKCQFLHELVFETNEQAEQAICHVSDAQHVEITNATDFVSYFVEVTSAYRLRFFTTYELDQRMQELLSSSNGLIPEILPDFNLNAEQERLIEEDMDKMVVAIQSGGLVAIVMKRRSQEAHRDLQRAFFDDLAWKNIYTRIAIILLALLAVPLNALYGVAELWFPGFVGIGSFICLATLVVALVLIAIAYFKDFRHGQGEGEASNG